MRLAPLLLLAVAGAAHAQPAPPATAEPAEIPHDWRIDGAIVGVGALLYGLSESLLKDALSPDACRWCASNAFDDGARDALRWDDTSVPHQVSNWIGFGAVPLAAYGGLALAASHDGRLRDLPVDALIVAEAAVIAALVTQVVKSSVGRERPWIHALPEDEKALVDRPSENNLSFFSGHSSYAWSLAVSAGVVANRRGYRWAPWIWGVGLPLAAATAYLRVAADRHWASDVLLGSAVGVAAGYGVPALLHPPRAPEPEAPTVQLVPMPGGVAVTGRF